MNKTPIYLEQPMTEASAQKLLAYEEEKKEYRKRFSFVKYLLVFFVCGCVGIITISYSQAYTHIDEAAQHIAANKFGFLDSYHSCTAGCYMAFDAVASHGAIGLGNGDGGMFYRSDCPTRCEYFLKNTSVG